jgi:hypothetical protein
METMGHYVDGLKFAGGSFSLMPREAIEQITSTAHAHGVYVSTGGWAEYVLTKGSQFFKPYLQVRNDNGEFFCSFMFASCLDGIKGLRFRTSSCRCLRFRMVIDIWDPR